MKRTLLRHGHDVLTLLSFRKTIVFAFLVLPFFVACASFPPAVQEQYDANKARIAGDCTTAVAKLEQAYLDGMGKVDNNGLSEGGGAAETRGQWYFRGICGPPDRQMAISWWTKANREPGFTGVEEDVPCLSDILSPHCQLGDNWQGRTPERQAALEQAIQGGRGSADTAMLAAVLQGAAQGMQNGAAIRNRNRANVVPTQTYASPSVPAYAPQTSAGYAGQNGTIDPALLRCIQLGRDSDGYYFQNNCNVKAKVWFVCRDAGTNQNEATAETDPDPGTRGPAPCYLPRDNTDWAACPYQDDIFGTDGNPWRGYTPFLCKHFN